MPVMPTEITFHPEYISKASLMEISHKSNPDSYAKLEAVYIQHVHQLLQENLRLKSKLQLYYDTFGKIEKLPESYQTRSNL